MKSSFSKLGGVWRSSVLVRLPAAKLTLGSHLGSANCGTTTIRCATEMKVNGDLFYIIINSAIPVGILTKIKDNPIPPPPQKKN